MSPQGGWRVNVYLVLRDLNNVVDALMYQTCRDGASHKIWRFPLSNVMAYLCQDALDLPIGF